MICLNFWIILEAKYGKKTELSQVCIVKYMNRMNEMFVQWIVLSFFPSLRLQCCELLFLHKLWQQFFSVFHFFLGLSLLCTYSCGSRSLWIRPSCLERKTSISSSLMLLDDAKVARFAEDVKGTEFTPDISLSTGEASRDKKSISPCLKESTTNATHWFLISWLARISS